MRILYVAYWGAAEPLGQSLIVPAVTRLADLGAEITLVTFEKPVDLARRDALAAIRATLTGHGIRWIALRYHRHPKVPATAFDLFHGWARGILARLRTRPDLIHARTFIGGLIGHALAAVLGVPWVYHNEGFYPDEQVDGGVWREGSRPHRLAKILERRMYAQADGLITLSHRARHQVEDLPAVRDQGKPMIVVPSCVDLGLFAANPRTMTARGEGLRLIYIGSIGLRYLFDRVARFAAVAAQELDRVHLRILTRTDPELVRTVVERSGLAGDAWDLDCVPHAAMPAELAPCHAGMFFLSQGLSEQGCSPTKVGEYWASGLPVVTTPNISDTEEIIEQERVGVIVRTHSDDEYRRAAHELWLLLTDPGLPQRCRRAAELHYALEPACERQMLLYREIVSQAKVPVTTLR